VLGPFKLEVYLIRPYRVVLRDFLNEAEIQWMLEYSKPRLSTARGISHSNFEGHSQEFRQLLETKKIGTQHGVFEGCPGPGWGSNPGSFDFRLFILHL
jgi:hypothetical protein